MLFKIFLSKYYPKSLPQDSYNSVSFMRVATVYVALASRISNKVKLSNTNINTVQIKFSLSISLVSLSLIVVFPGSMNILCLALLLLVSIKTVKNFGIGLAAYCKRA